MVQLGDGFAAAVKEVGLGEFGEAFSRALSQLAEDLYRRLRDDLIAEVRAEVQRVGVSEATTALSAALERVPSPQVHVAAPIVQAPDVLPADVVVNVPKPDAPKVTVQPRKHVEVIRDADGRITGADVT